MRLKSRYLLLASLFVIVSAGTACEAKDAKTVALPPLLLGTWLVTEVHVDTGASRTTHYQYNDPLIVGRRFTITPDQLTSSTAESYEPCRQPKVKVRRITASRLIEDSLAGRGDSSAPTPKDYELPLAYDANVEALSIICEHDGLFGSTLGHKIVGAWIVILGKNQLALRWYDETILVLNRLPDDAKPEPSFDCAKAVNAVEKTICRSADLAALDKSMAQAYRHTLNFLSSTNDSAVVELLRSVKNTQKHWLAQRNTCDADTRCLEKSMRDRLLYFDEVINQRARGLGITRE